MILTRFSRVTFNVAHKYLGLTTELLRTENAINELARHPLPPEFYQGGGMQWLRQRFTPDFKDDDTDAPVTDEGAGYTDSTPKPSTTRGEMKTPKLSTVFSPPTVSPEDSPVNPARHRSQVNAGDLLSMAASPTSFRSHSGSKGALFTPGGRGRNVLRADIGHTPHSPDDRRKPKTNDFDLKEGVMDCIAKSIGLIQPPISRVGSPEASPSLAATEPVYPSFSSSFRSLSFLSAADDTSSVTAGSSVFNLLRNDTIDNEVEILFFKSGDTLVRAGERNAGNSYSTLPPLCSILTYELMVLGLFFVIEGFLDVSLPTEEIATNPKYTESAPLFSPVHGVKRSESSDNTSVKGARVSKHLFTVKAGGIAGYLCEHTRQPKYSKRTVQMLFVL